MGRRGGVAGRVEHRAAADRDHVRMAAEAGVVDGAMDVVHVARIVLHRFAARHDEDGRRQAEHRAMAVGVLANLLRQARMVIEHALIEHDDESRGRSVGGARHDVAQQQVGRRHDTGREVDRVLEVDAYFLPDDIHVVYVTANNRASDAATSPVARITRL